MDVVSVKTYARFGKPAAVGKIGTVIVHPPNGDGEILLEFTLRRKGMRLLKHPDYRKLDSPKKKVYPDHEIG